MAEDGIAHVIKMRHLAVVKEQAVFQLARIADHTAIAHDHIGAHISAVADLAIPPDDSWALNVRAGLHHGSFSEKHLGPDHCLGRYGGVIGRLQFGGEVFGEARQGLPSGRFGVKHRCVLRLAEVE